MFDWMFAKDYTYALSQWLFIKLLAFNYLAAFISLLGQLLGLYGSNGIMPMEQLVANLRSQYGRILWREIPSIFWFNTDDRFLKSMVYLGITSAIMVIAGILPTFFLLLLWGLYLSFVTLGSEFLSFQWDILLLEVGFIAIFYSMQSPPPPLMVFLLWFVLFRFMFTSGLAKLLWGSKDWRTLEAMEVHYETQPLPTRWAYYLHQMPKWFAKFSTCAVFFSKFSFRSLSLLRRQFV